jgi:hypothetical protein
VLHRKVQPVVLRDDEHALQPGFVLWMCLHNLRVNAIRVKKRQKAARITPRGVGLRN